MLSEKKADVLSNFLVEDKPRAYRLLNLEPEEALREMKACGLDVTIDDVKEFGEQLVALVNSNNELSEDDLQAVNGGVLIVTAGVLAAGVALFGAGLSASVAIGIAVANHKGW